MAKKSEKTILTESLMELTVIALKAVAKDYRVKYYSKLKKAELVEQLLPFAKRQKQLLPYILATVNFYGGAPCSYVVELFNRHNQAETTEEEMCLAVKQCFDIELTSEVLVEKGLFINGEFEVIGLAELEGILKEAAAKPRFEPPIEELLKYADSGYYVWDEKYEALQSYLLQQLALKPESAAQVLEDVNYMCVRGYRLNKIAEYVLHSAGIYTQDKRIEALIPLLIAISNNTRMWPLNGNKPDELFEAKPAPVAGKGEPITSTKIGRNDPCPCGSGKKYKKCCGR